MNNAVLSNVTKLAATIEPQLISDRRNFHKHAEFGWTEFRTSAPSEVA